MGQVSRANPGHFSGVPKQFWSWTEQDDAGSTSSKGGTGVVES